MLLAIDVGNADSRLRYARSLSMSNSRTTKDAQALMKQAYDRTGKIPRIIYTDKLQAYLDGIELTFGADTKHKQGNPFDVENNTNIIERMHGTIKSRTKVMRGLHTPESARLFLDGWLVHYNFFRPHMSLNDRTPASVAGIRFPFRNWKDVTEQPYEKTARIPIGITRDVIPPQRRIVRVAKRKRVRISPHRPRITPPVPSITQIRMKK